ncbi:SDR family oxidoreductase [Rhodopseudomonas sp. RCAM05734]|uniref:SDR family oxidoreductase n=1 Tax=Rhodopseudomonas sp. RCAM05734 TaxID=3457549 RepID=UPI004043AB0F
MTNPTSSSKVILISGASSGIGEATARHLAAAGHRVVLGARRLERIAAIAGEIRQAGGEALHHELDVARLGSFRAFVLLAKAHYGRIDVLVNNAGVAPLAMMDELRVCDWNHMIDVNLRGVLHGIAAVLPVMKEQGAGHIVNVASTSAHRIVPTMAVYSATKVAVRALSEGLRQESKDLRVTVVSPGMTRTELAGTISDPKAKATISAMMDEQGIPASAIAEAIAYAIGQPGNVDVGEVIVRPTAQG